MGVWTFSHGYVIPWTFLVWPWGIILFSKLISVNNILLLCVVLHQMAFHQSLRVFFYSNVLCVIYSWVNRPWQNWALLLNILELPHDASTTFDSIALAPLMFSNPLCAMEAHEDPCSDLVVKRKVSLYELFPNKMELLFAIEVATVREMHGEIVLSFISKAFLQIAFGPRQFFVFLLLWFYLDVKHQQSDLYQPVCCLSDLLKHPDIIREDIMFSDGQEESNRIPVVIFVHIFSIFTCVWREKRLVQFFWTSLSYALL